MEAAEWAISIKELFDQLRTEIHSNIQKRISDKINSFIAGNGRTFNIY